MKFASGGQILKTSSPIWALRLARNIPLTELTETDRIALKIADGLMEKLKVGTGTLQRSLNSMEIDFLLENGAKKQAYHTSEFMREYLGDGL